MYFRGDFNAIDAIQHPLRNEEEEEEFIGNGKFEKTQMYEVRRGDARHDWGTFERD